MAKPYASFTVDFYEDKVKVSIDNFEKINSAKIQSSLMWVLREWQSQQQQAILNDRIETRKTPKTKETTATDSPPLLKDNLTPELKEALQNG